MTVYVLTLVELPEYINEKVKKYAKEEKSNISSYISRAIANEVSHLPDITRNDAMYMLTQWWGSDLKSTQIVLNKDVNMMIRKRALELNLKTSDLYKIMVNNYIVDILTEECKEW